MRSEYDFSDSKPNPYTKLLKKEIKIKIDEDALIYFKKPGFGAWRPLSKSNQQLSARLCAASPQTGDEMGVTSKICRFMAVIQDRSRTPRVIEKKVSAPGVLLFPCKGADERHDSKF